MLDRILQSFEGESIVIPDRKQPYRTPLHALKGAYRLPLNLRIDLMPQYNWINKTHVEPKLPHGFYKSGAQHAQMPFLDPVNSGEDRC